MVDFIINTIVTVLGAWVGVQFVRLYLLSRTAS